MNVKIRHLPLNACCKKTNDRFITGCDVVHFCTLLSQAKENIFIFADSILIGPIAFRCLSSSTVCSNAQILFSSLCFLLKYYPRYVSSFRFFFYIPLPLPLLFLMLYTKKVLNIDLPKDIQSAHKNENLNLDRRKCQQQKYN